MANQLPGQTFAEWMKAQQGGGGNATPAVPTVLLADPILTMSDTLFQVDNPFYWSRGKYYQMDVSPVILNGRVYLPIRFVAQALGLDIQWHATDQSVVVSTPQSAWQRAVTTLKNFNQSVKAGYNQEAARIFDWLKALKK